MQIAFHMGAHCTDENRLIKSLLKNKGRLAEEGVIVPPPGRARKVMAEAVLKLAGGRADAATQEFLLDSIMDEDEAERMVLSFDNFLGAPGRALENGQLYHLIGDKARRLYNVFPDHQPEFFIGIRNLATFIPALFELDEERDFQAFLAKNSCDPLALSWARPIALLREAMPDSPITVWCNEDTPMIWREIMQEVAGIDPQVKLMGGFDVLSEIMAREGMQRLRAYMHSHPPVNEIQRRRIIAAFLDKYALDEAIEEEIDLPGWTQELVEDLTANYDDDVLEIARIPGVTVLTP